MPYAANDKISESSFEGAIEITGAQYQDALSHLQSTDSSGSFGLVRVYDSKMILTFTPIKKDDHEAPVWVDGKWLHKPIIKPDVDVRAKQIREIESRLVELDSASLRPLRAIAAGSATQFDHAKLEALDAEAKVLRAELRGLLN